MKRKFLKICLVASALAIAGPIAAYNMIDKNHNDESATNSAPDPASASAPVAVQMSSNSILKTISELDSNAEAADNRVEKAVQWAIDIANDQSHGYSQGAENATYYRPYTGSREGPDYDCSALVYHAFNQAGFDIIAAWRNNPKYYSRYNGRQESGDADTIWEDLQVVGGFSKYSWESVKNNLQRGDILCNPQHHVAIYIGDGRTVEARGVNNPLGGDWRTGDQGGEIDFYDAYGRGWIEVYRYTGK